MSDIYVLYCPKCEHQKFMLYCGEGRGDDPYEGVSVKCLNCGHQFIPLPEDWWSDDEVEGIQLIEENNQ